MSILIGVVVSGGVILLLALPWWLDGLREIAEHNVRVDLDFQRYGESDRKYRGVITEERRRRNYMTETKQKAEALDRHEKACIQEALRKDIPQDARTVLSAEARACRSRAQMLFEDFARLKAERKKDMGDQRVRQVLESAERERKAEVR